MRTYKVGSHALIISKLSKTSHTSCSGTVKELSSLILSVRGGNVLFISVTTDYELKYSFNILALSALFSANLLSSFIIGIV